MYITYICKKIDHSTYKLYAIVCNINKRSYLLKKIKLEEVEHVGNGITVRKTIIYCTVATIFR